MKLRVESIDLDIRRPDWRRKLVRELERQLGDPSLAEQTAYAIQQRVAAAAVRALGADRDTLSPTTRRTR